MINMSKARATSRLEKDGVRESKHLTVFEGDVNIQSVVVVYLASILNSILTSSSVKLANITNLPYKDIMIYLWFDGRKFPGG